MAASKNILRSLFVMALVLGAGFLGLWFLGGKETKVVNQNPDTLSNLNNGGVDQFSDIGGKTPQETLALLIKTLEKNDLISAVEYFVPENREMESEDLTKLSDANILGDLIKDLKNVKSGKAIDDNHYNFEIVDLSAPAPQDQATIEIQLIKNKNGVWKVISL